MKINKKIYYWWNNIGVVLFVDLIWQIIIFPLLRIFNTWLLPQAEVPFVSISNLKRILIHHPGVIIGLIAEVVIIFWLAYYSLAILMLRIKSANGSKGKVKFGWFPSGITIGLTIINVIGWLPIFSILFRTPLLTGLRIPECLLDYGTRNSLVMMFMLSLTIIIWFLICRYLFVLPTVILQHVTISQASEINRRARRQGRWFHQIIAIIKVLITGGLLSWGINLVIYFIIYVSSRELVTKVCTLIAQLSAFIICSIVISQLTALFIEEPITQINMGNKALAWWPLIGLVLLMINAWPVINTVFNGNHLSAPIVVSHRGVTNHNGVQNSIPALIKTHYRYHPDYVEMDIHETKDNQFVVMHDENLKKLTGVNKRPRDLPLKEITKLKQRENGYSTSVVSLDQYLQVALKIHQKLIIEIKTTQHDSADVVQRFNRHYGSLINKHHYIVHSMDYRVIKKLHSINPQMRTLYIEAYNLGNPLPKLEGFNSEYSSLNLRFIEDAHRHHQPVFVWTVNNTGAMQQAVNEHVDGIVTDNLPQLQKTIYNAKHFNYGQRYLNYINPVINLP